jgi:hypothetical protein
MKRILIKLLGICLAACPAFQKNLGEKGNFSALFPTWLPTARMGMGKKAN